MDIQVLSIDKNNSLKNPFKNPVSIETSWWKPLKWFLPRLSQIYDRFSPSKFASSNFQSPEPWNQVLLGVGRGDFALRLLRDWSSAHGLCPLMIDRAWKKQIAHVGIYDIIWLYMHCCMRCSNKFIDLLVTMSTCFFCCIFFNVRDTFDG